MYTFPVLLEAVNARNYGETVIHLTELLSNHCTLILSDVNRQVCLTGK